MSSSTIVTADDSVLRVFDSSIVLPSASTINLFYDAVTSLTSFENEATLWEEYVVNSVPLLFKSEAEFRDHSKEIKAAIVLGIRNRFDLQNGSQSMRANDVLTMSDTEADRFRLLNQKQRKSEKDKDKKSDRGKFKKRLAYLVDLINKRANSRFLRMVEKHFPKIVADSAIVCTQV